MQKSKPNPIELESAVPISRSIDQLSRFSPMITETPAELLCSFIFSHSLL